MRVSRTLDRRIASRGDSPTHVYLASRFHLLQACGTVLRTRGTVPLRLHRSPSLSAIAAVHAPERATCVSLPFLFRDVDAGTVEDVRPLRSSLGPPPFGSGLEGARRSSFALVWMDASHARRGERSTAHASHHEASMTVKFDGGSRGNPGNAGAGAVVVDRNGSKVRGNGPDQDGSSSSRSGETNGWRTEVLMERRACRCSKPCSLWAWPPTTWPNTRP